MPAVTKNSLLAATLQALLQHISIPLALGVIREMYALNRNWHIISMYKMKTLTIIKPRLICVFQQPPVLAQALSSQ